MGKVVRLEKQSYAFEGRRIKLNERDYNLWRRTFHAIPDFDAELLKLDVYYEENDIKNWFCRCSAALNKVHQRHIADWKSGQPEEKRPMKTVSPEEAAAYHRSLGNENNARRCEQGDEAEWLYRIPG